MEAEGAKILRGLRYIPFIGDGDSKAYSAVCKDQPYGPAEFIRKEECIAHVTKRMGSGLRTLLRDYKGKKQSFIESCFTNSIAIVWVGFIIVTYLDSNHGWTYVMEEGRLLFIGGAPYKNKQ